MSEAADHSVDLSAIQIRVLIVDDDESHAQAVAESLERVNYECVVASSGVRGASLIESDTFDVIVTDLKMDDMDGLEILAKANEELPESLDLIAEDPYDKGWMIRIKASNPGELSALLDAAEYAELIEGEGCSS